MKMRRIDVSSRQRHLRVGVRKIRQAVRAALDAVGADGCEISIALVDDARIQEINRQYLDHDRPTDVISFDLSEGPDEGPVHNGSRVPGPSGEIIVSAERAVLVAAEHGGDSEAELLLYVVHGLLHLVDYDDRTTRDATRMHALEDRIMTSLGYGRTFSDGGAVRIRNGEAS